MPTIKNILVIFFAAGLTAALAVSLNHSNAAGSDTTPPVTTVSLSPSTPNGNNDWYVSPVQVTFSATDLESGVDTMYYQIDGGTWQSVSYSNTLNLAPNPSFEIADVSSSTGIDEWEATTIDGATTYSQDTATYYTGFDTSSVKIVTAANGWHGVNHADSFAVTSPYSNMSASVWVKTENVVDEAYFKVYSVSYDIDSNPVYTEIAQSPTITGTLDWQQLTLDFAVNDPDSIGVYLDLGLEDQGTVWFDAVSLSESTFDTNFTIVVGADGEHEIEYYSEDRAGNKETHNCPININCINFKIDQTAPGNWRDSGAIRDPGGGSNADHELYVYVTVDDLMSGLSINSDKYMYKTELEPNYGYYSNLLGCNSTWNADQWVGLLNYPTIDGIPSYELRTQKTDLCNDNWKLCKTIRFYSEDMAGNVNTKDFCINGPWIRINGKGIVRANKNIDMIAEPEDANTDGMIEAGGSFINFFTSSYGWRVLNSPEPINYYYDDLLKIVPPPTTITDINVNSGTFLINGDITLDNNAIPNNYDNKIFDQIVFINGNLTIDNDIKIDEDSTALYIVKGDVSISRIVSDVHIGLIADGVINTAYDLNASSSTQTLTLKGTFVADKFNFQRTLQGTNNDRFPSEDFYYEPKYLVNLRQYIGEDTVIWLDSE